MTNPDYWYHLKVLSQRVTNLEAAVQKHSTPDISDQDWDNARLMKEWQISKRTTSNYRKNGLNHYKRGGRVMYSKIQREEFLKKQK